MTPSRREPGGGQLPLSLERDAEEGRRLPDRVPLPQPVDGHAPFDDDAYFFEPWWPGARAAVKREGDRLVIQTEHLADPLLAFPELAGIRLGLRADGLVIEGTLLALDRAGRPDPALLRDRLRGRTSAHGEGAFVAADLPYLEGESIARMPFVERRRRLTAVLGDVDHCVVSRGVVGEGRMLGRAAAALGLRAISARRLDARWTGGSAGDAWLRLPVVGPSAETTTPFLVLLERLPLSD